MLAYLIYRDQLQGASFLLLPITIGCLIPMLRLFEVTVWLNGSKERLERGAVKAKSWTGTAKDLLLLWVNRRFLRRWSGCAALRAVACYLGNCRPTSRTIHGTPPRYTNRPTGNLQCKTV